MSAHDPPDVRSRARGHTSTSSDSLIRQLARAPRRELEDLATGSMPSGAAGADDAREGLPSVGDVIDGRYQLEGLIGSGGMGVVFAARNLRTEKKVALKYLLIPRKERSAERRAARFLREARAAGRVRHPNVVDMIDVGGDPAHPYLVMELLRGQSLYARMQQAPLPMHEAIAIMLSAMRGVGEAHRQGVIHRDIKPENIFLAESIEAGASARAQNITTGSSTLVPKVLDFGVSRITEGSDERPTTLTQAGNVIGTPSYMPLEQLRGKSDVDARADVYSLGVVLYEALCGKRPFEAKNAHDLAIKMATESPARLVLHDGRSEPRLEAVLMRALARAPEDRYPSVDAFATALSNYTPAPHARSRWVAGVAALIGVGALVIWGMVLAAGSAAPARVEARAEVPRPAVVAKKLEASQRAPALAAPPIAEKPTPVVDASGSVREQSMERSIEAPAAAATVTGRSADSPRKRAVVQNRAPVVEAREVAAPEQPAPIERAKTLLPDDF